MPSWPDLFPAMTDEVSSVGSSSTWLYEQAPLEGRVAATPPALPPQLAVPVDASPLARVTIGAL